MADAHGTADRTERALEIVTDALATVERTGERFYESELLRLKGDLLLKTRNDFAAADRCFRRALAVATAQHARLLETRARGSLCRLHTIIKA